MIHCWFCFNLNYVVSCSTGPDSALLWLQLVSAGGRWDWSKDMSVIGLDIEFSREFFYMII